MAKVRAAIVATYKACLWLGELGFALGELTFWLFVFWFCITALKGLAPVLWLIATTATAAH